MMFSSAVITASRQSITQLDQECNASLQKLEIGAKCSELLVLGT
jgi:hypothetical protein